MLESAIDARDPDAVALRADPLVNLLCRFAARLRAKVLDHGAAGASVPKAQCLQAVESLGAPARVLMIDHPNNDTYLPTTRALCVVATGESVMRDMFYNGNPRPEPGAIVCRVAPSFTRFGNFEILASRNDIDLLRKLVDYTLATDFPALGAPGKETYVEYF